MFDPANKIGVTQNHSSLWPANAFRDIVLIRIRPENAQIVCQFDS